MVRRKRSASELDARVEPRVPRLLRERLALGERLDPVVGDLPAAAGVATPNGIASESRSVEAIPTAATPSRYARPANRTYSVHVRHPRRAQSRLVPAAR
jgi:hypothetical protein